MKAYIVGYRPTEKGYLYFCTCESKSRAVIGETVLAVFSKEKHEISDEISVFCYKNILGKYSYKIKKG